MKLLKVLGSILLIVAMLVSAWKIEEKKFQQIKEDAIFEMWDKVDSLECELSVARDSINVIKSKEDTTDL